LKENVEPRRCYESQSGRGVDSDETDILTDEDSDQEEEGGPFCGPNKNDSIKESNQDFTGKFASIS